MDKFTELYSYLKEEGLTDLSAEEFKNKYAAGTANNTELYSYLKDEKLTDLDAEKFNAAYILAFTREVFWSCSKMESCDLAFQYGKDALS